MPAQPIHPPAADVDHAVPAAVAAATAAAERWQRRPAALLQVLREAQQAAGWLPRPALAAVARALQVPLADVQGTASFYRFLHLKPAGRIRLLMADHITDRMAGSDALLTRLSDRLAVSPGGVSADGRVGLDRCSCIGLCDQGPSLLVDHRWVLPRLTPTLVDAVADLVHADLPRANWADHLPSGAMAVSAPIGRAGPLLATGRPVGDALKVGQAMGPAAVLAELEASGLRGRGGAGFGTGAKWRSCAQSPIRSDALDAAGSQTRAGLSPHRHIVCNADEGEPGTFKDRVLLTEQAHRLFDGMTLAALAVDARHGWLYLRGEYAWMVDALQATLAQRRQLGLLGRHVGGQSGFDFDIHLHLGAGAYVCGEETSLLESLEGRRGTPRNRPPYPTTAGLFGQPTVLNNVETFCAAAEVVAHGAAAWRSLGTTASTGTKLHSVAGDCAHPGVYEYAAGTPVADMLADCGAADAQAVQVGGPSGRFITAAEFHRRIAFEDLPSAGALTVFGPQRDPFDIARHFTHFFAHESCGFCTPCRVGTRLMAQRMDRIADGHGRQRDLDELHELTQLLPRHAHCGLGHTAGHPVHDTMAATPEAYRRRLKPADDSAKCGVAQPAAPDFDLTAAVTRARQAIAADADSDPGAP